MNENPDKFSTFLEWMIFGMIGVGITSVVILVWVLLGLERLLSVPPALIDAAAIGAALLGFSIVFALGLNVAITCWGKMRRNRD